MTGFKIIILTLFFAHLSLVAFSQTATKESIREIDRIMIEFVKDDGFNGVILLARNNEILYSNAFGKASFEWDIPNAVDTRFKIASITKTFTAVLVLHLAEKERLSLSDKITDYLPDYPTETGDKINIEHLLTQTAGIPDYLEIPDFLSTLALQEHDRHSFPKFFQDMDLEFEPGTDWSYGNSEYYLLGLIIERVTGMSYEEAMQTYILNPVGMQNTGFAQTGKVVPKLASGYMKKNNQFILAPFIHSSVCFSAGMMYADALDLLRFMQALYTKESILSREYLDILISKKVPDYGCGVFVGRQNINGVDVPVYVHLGSINGYASQITYFPDNKYTVILIDNTQQCVSRIYFAIRDKLPGFGSIAN